MIEWISTAIPKKSIKICASSWPLELWVIVRELFAKNQYSVFWVIFKENGDGIWGDEIFSYSTHWHVWCFQSYISILTFIFFFSFWLQVINHIPVNFATKNSHWPVICELTWKRTRVSDFMNFCIFSGSIEFYLIGK